MKKMTSILMLVNALCAGAEEQPQAPTVPTLPGNEILVYEIKTHPDGLIRLDNGKNITNQPGYDSQPKFSNDGNKLYYTHAVTTESGFQMDIYQYDMHSGVTQPYLETKESEYSPTPLANGNGLSVVQVDEHGDQYVVFFNAQEEPGKQSQKFSDLKQVGYFNWTSDGRLWSFVLNDQNGGDLYQQVQGQPAQKLSTHVGRAFITDQQQNHLYYVDKNTIPWRIKSRSVSKQKAQDVMPLPMSVEDFTLDSQGRFWAGRDNTLYVSTDQKRWYIVHEFNDPNLHQITRVTTNPGADKIAIVFAEKTNK